MNVLKAHLRITIDTLLKGGASGHEQDWVRSCKDGKPAREEELSTEGVAFA